MCWPPLHLAALTRASRPPSVRPPTVPLSALRSAASRAFFHRVALRVPVGRCPRVLPPPRAPALLAAAALAFFRRAALSRSVRPLPTRSSTTSLSHTSRPLPSRSSTAPFSTSRSAAFRALFSRVAPRAAIAAGAWRAHPASSRAATGPRAIHARDPRVSQPLGPQRLRRPHGPRVLQPRGPRGVTTGRAARAVAGRISGPCVEARASLCDRPSLPPRGEPRGYPVRSPASAGLVAVAWNARGPRMRAFRKVASGFTPGRAPSSAPGPREL